MKENKMYKDYKQEMKLTLIIEHAKSAGEALYRAEEITDSIMARYHGDDPENDSFSGCVAICDDEGPLMIDISVPKEDEETTKREWVVVEPGRDIIAKSVSADQAVN